MKRREPVLPPASPPACNCFEPIAHPAQRLTPEPDADVMRDPHGESTWAR